MKDLHNAAICIINTSMNDTSNQQGIVAIINNPRDFTILQEHHWYRIPVASAPKPWPPKWLAFYQTKVFKQEAYAIRYYGQVRLIDRVSRRELFPNEYESAKADKQYYQVHLDRIETLPQPIPSLRWRRIVFIPTTWRKFTQAGEINDLYNESPLEDILWVEMKRLKINAERQYDVKIAEKRYFLDFAVFCNEGKIDVETDGDTWHANRERAGLDNVRNNAVETEKWNVLRFNTAQVKEDQAEYCVKGITKMVNKLGGLSDKGLVPPRYFTTPEGITEQTSMFEETPRYDLEDDL